MKFRSILKKSAASLLISNGVYIYTFLCNIALMRMLLPEDFGLLALATSLVGLIEIVTTFAFKAVLVQQREQRSMVRAVFQLALAVIVLKVAIGLLFWLVTEGRYDAVVWQLFWMVMLSKVFAGMGPLLVARLDKRGDFVRASLVTNGATAVAVTLAVVAVSLGAGVHGLALRLALPALLVFVAMMVFYPALFPGDLRGVNRRQLRVVGAAATRLYFQSGAEVTYLRVPLLIIEALFGAAVLGLFTQATYLVTLLQRITSAINHQVAFAFFARNRHDKTESAHGYRWLLLFNLVAALPVMALIALLPEQIVLFLWGESWLGVVPFLTVMAAMALLLPVFSLLKSRLLGLRRNTEITVVYLAGFAVFALGLVVPPPVDPALWIAGLATGSYVVMVAALWFFLERSNRGGAATPSGEPRATPAATGGQD